MDEIKVISAPPEGVPAVHTVYPQRFFKKRSSLSWRAPIVCKALIDTFKLYKGAKVLDLGCGIADYVHHFNQNGIWAKGIEGSCNVLPYLVDKNVDIHDLRLSLKKEITPSFYTLAYSLEVAEHIEKQYADTYLDNLCWASNTVLITAAPPGQEGHGHVNCQFKQWWSDKMNERNYARRKDLEGIFARSIYQQKNKREVTVYAKNVMIFKAIQFTGRH